MEKQESLQPRLTEDGNFSNIQITNHHPLQITSPYDLEVGEFYEQRREYSKGESTSIRYPEKILSVDLEKRTYRSRIYDPYGFFHETDSSMTDLGISPYRDNPAERRWNARNFLILIEKPENADEKQ